VQIKFIRKKLTDYFLLTINLVEIINKKVLLYFHKEFKGQKMTKLSFKHGLKDGIPIALGYFAVSFAFGVSVAGKGIPWYIATFMSASNLTSAGQFAGAEIVAVLGSVFGIILTQLIINSRYFLMSLTLSQRLDSKVKFLDKILMSFGITDEIFAVAVARGKPITRNYFLGLMLLPFLFWTGGTCLGAVAGYILPKIVLKSLEIALYAMFIAIVIPAGLGDKKIFFVVGVSVTISCVIYYLPIDNQTLTHLSCIICAVIASILGAIFFPVKINEEKHIETSSSSESTSLSINEKGVENE